MTREEKIEQLERMLVNLPEIMSPLKVSKSVPIGKNRVYELIKTKELRAFICSRIGERRENRKDKTR